MVSASRPVLYCLAALTVASLLAGSAGAQSTLDAYQKAVYDSTPLLYYTFDNDTIGTGAVVDAMGVYHGAYVNSTLGASVLPVQGPHGVVGHVPYTSPGADFRGREAYVSTGLPAAFGTNMKDGFTVSFWINTTAASTLTQLFGTLNDGAAMGLSIDLNRNQNFASSSGSTLFFVRANDDARVLGATTAPIYNEQWHHVAMVVEPQSILPANYSDYMKVYINGQATPLTFGTSNITNSSPFVNFQYSALLGALNARGTPSSFANAGVDEFAIFGRPLSQAEIQSHLDAMPKFDFAYDGTYPVNSTVPPLGQTTWQEVNTGGLTQAINTEGDGAGGSVAKTGYMRINDSTTGGRSSFYQLFDGQNDRPGPVADLYWTYETRLKVDSLGGAYQYQSPYLGVRDEGGSAGTGYGKSVMLQFAWVPNEPDKMQLSFYNSLSTTGSYLGELLLGEYYDFKVQKYWDDSSGQFLVQTYVDGSPFGNAKLYSSFVNGGDANNGFGFFSSTPGTADITFDFVTFVIPEPSAALLLGTALLGLLLWRRAR